jgi:hypothetical protein
VVPEQRGALIAALLTLVRAWYAAGQPMAPIPHTMGSFQAWADMIGGILAAVDVKGFLENAQALQEQDDDALQWAAFLHAWHAHYQQESTLVAAGTRYQGRGSR